jgi:hypothetical protein
MQAFLVRIICTEKKKENRTGKRRIGAHAANKQG